MIVEPLRCLERATYPLDLERALPPWDGVCDWCGSTIGLAETYTVWCLFGGFQYLHLDCQRTYGMKLESELARFESVR